MLADKLESREMIILSSTTGTVGLEYYRKDNNYWWIAYCCCWSGRSRLFSYEPAGLTKIEWRLLADSTIVNINDGAIVGSYGAANINGQYIHLFEFCDTNRTVMGVIRLLQVIISDINTGELIHELIPCYNKNTLVSGVYDLINSKFYAIDGVAVSGPDVNQQRPWE